METKTKFLSWYEFGEQTPFINYTLSELNTVQIDKTKKLGNKQPVYEIIRHTMGLYGLLNAYAGTNLRTEDGRDWGVTFNAYNITEDFPVENEYLIQQLYGYTEGLINIGFLPGDKNDDDCAFAFDYNLKDSSCKFKKLYYGSTQEFKKFDSLSEMLEAIKEVTKLNDLWE